MGPFSILIRDVKVHLHDSDLVIDIFLRQAEPGFIDRSLRFGFCGAISFYQATQIDFSSVTQSQFKFNFDLPQLFMTLFMTLCIFGVIVSMGYQA